MLREGGLHSNQIAASRLDILKRAEWSDRFKIHYTGRPE